MIQDVQAKGDAARGELVFRRTDMSCFQCHAIGGAGGQLAPDLRAIGASSPIDYLIDSLIDPNKAIKDGYQSLVIATKSGDVFSGIKVSQDDKQIVLRDAVQDRLSIPIASIRKQRPGGSLMPAGLGDLLTRGEFLDLIKFMSELGKPGAYQPDNALLVRRWRVLDAKASERLAADTAALQSPEAAAALPWQPAYSMVSGVLPMNAIALSKTQSAAFVRGEIDVTSPGRIALSIGDANGLRLWVDGKSVEIKENVELDLARGVHALTFKVDLSQRGPDGLRVELRDIAGSGGHAQPMGGR